MLVDATTQSATAASVNGAIRQAARLTGTSFQYLLATAQVESGLNPSARATTTSAGGLFQFIEQTWLGTLKEAGPSFGYDRYAEAITRTPSGRYEVHDPVLRRAILDLRQDPTANAVMAGAFTRSNAEWLTARLGRAPTDGELYMAHFLGAAGAARLISSDPNARAADLFPNAARANRSIFFDRQGRARSAAEVAEVLSRRHQVAFAAPATMPPPSPAIPSKSRSPALVGAAGPVASATAAGRPDLARDPAALARAYQALALASRRVPVQAVRPVQQPLQRTAQAEPIAPVVVKVWSVRSDPQTVAGAPGVERFSTGTPGAVAANRFSLFEDFAPDVRPLFTGG
jgi:hypothetical protein